MVEKQTIKGKRERIWREYTEKYTSLKAYNWNSGPNTSSQYPMLHTSKLVVCDLQIFLKTEHDCDAKWIIL